MFDVNYYLKMLKTVLITGSTRGIGLELAKMFKNTGNNVIITGTQQNKVDEIVNQFDSPNVTGYELDMTRQETLEKFKDTNMKIDVLIHNAGMLSRDNLVTVSESRLNKMFMVNSLGPILLTKYLLPNMIKCNTGAILFFCPPYAIDEKTTMLTPYMQTKLAQTTFMKSIANMTNKKNISIAGFWTKYPIYTDALTHRNIGTKENCMDPKIISKTVELLLKDDPNKIRGKVFYDHDYLLSNNVDLKQFALGDKTMMLDQLFMNNLTKQK